MSYKEPNRASLYIYIYTHIYTHTHTHTHTHTCVFHRKYGWRKESLGPLKPHISVAIRGNFLKGVSRTWNTGPYYHILVNVY